MILHRAFTASSRAGVMTVALTMLSCTTTTEPPEFVGVSHWTQFDRGADPAHLDDPSTGRSTVFVDRLPPSGATTFPVGTHVLRIMGDPGDPSTWDAHGMVKVGGDFNAGGAVGWEYYGLDMSFDEHGELVAHTRWHGVGPADGDGYPQLDGGPVLGCNHCHGAATWNDSIIGSELQLVDF